MEIIRVFGQGTKVKIRLGNVEAYISAIIIRHNVVTYELTYFSNGEYDYISLPEKDFEVVDSIEFLSIGFHR